MEESLMSVRLYVKLPKIELEKEGFEKTFADFDQSLIISSKIIRERKKGECRGFGFVTVATEEAANEFIAKYNGQTFVYNDQPCQDENGGEFKLLVEVALPREKGKEKIEKPEGEPKPKPEPKKPEIATSPSSTPSSSSSTPTPSPVRSKPKKAKKSRNESSSTDNKPTSVTESIQPDPRWAASLMELKERLAAQTTN
jgi:RNA recognition motif-containing protein